MLGLSYVTDVVFLGMRRSSSLCQTFFCVGSLVLVEFLVHKDLDMLIMMLVCVEF